MGEDPGTSVREKYERIFLPVGRLLARTGISANSLTVISLIISGVCTYFLWQRQILLGIFFLLFAGFVDMLDGSVARAKGQSSHFGAVLDHTVDRYAEFLFLLGFGLGNYVSFFWIYVAFFSMIMASFVRAKAESVGGIKSAAGIGIERKEKIALLTIGALLTYWYPDALTLAVVLLAILSQIAVFQRLHFTYNNAD